MYVDNVTMLNLYVTLTVACYSSECCVPSGLLCCTLLFIRYFSEFEALSNCNMGVFLWLHALTLDPPPSLETSKVFNP